MRAEKCFPVERLSPSTAVMAEPTACAIHGMDVLDARPGWTFSCSAPGRLALSSRSCSCTVGLPEDRRGADRIQTFPGPRLRGRQDGAHRPGAPGRLIGTLRDNAPDGYDVVVEATGAVTVGEMCLPLVRDGGTISILRGHGRRGRGTSLHPYEVFRRRADRQGVFRSDPLLRPRLGRAPLGSCAHRGNRHQRVPPR